MSFSPADLKDVSVQSGICWTEFWMFLSLLILVSYDFFPPMAKVEAKEVDVPFLPHLNFFSKAQRTDTLMEFHEILNKSLLPFCYRIWHVCLSFRPSFWFCFWGLS